MRVWTVGHSTHTLDRFVTLLTAHGIALVADIRAVPRSRRHPWFIPTPSRRACRTTVRRALAQERRIAGPDPWKANTLEWFMPSPPPENNFDVIPRVRSVEPMKDIRRQVEQQTGVRQRYRDGRPMNCA